MRSIPTLTKKRPFNTIDNDIIGLDDDISDTVNVIVKNTEFEIKTKIAEQMELLKTLIENDKNEKSFQIDMLEAYEFQLVIYLIQFN